MPVAYTGFGSGPYDELTYDRSWVTAFVTLGVSVTDVYTPNVYSNVRITLDTAVEAIKAADGYFYTSLALGIGAALPFVSIGGNYQGRLTFGAALAEERTGATEYSTSISFGVSLNDALSEIYYVNDTVTLGTSLTDSITAKVTIKDTVTLGSDFTYTNTAAVTVNSALTFSTGFVVFVSSTGRFLDQWTSVSDTASEIWTSVPLGFS